MPNAAPVSARSRRFARLTRVAVLVGYGVTVAGCSAAIETVRSMRGINKNDPDLVTAPFSGNMAAIETAPYPNLASVPPPPSRATTAAERQNLTENLIAERAAAQAAGGVSGTASPASGAAPTPVSKSQPGNSPLAKSPPAPTPEVAAATATRA